MEYTIFISVYTALFSAFVFWAYRRGLKDGLNINQGKPIAPIKTPVKRLTEARGAKKEQVETDKFMQGLQNIMSYTGDPQKAGDSS